MLTATLFLASLWLADPADGGAFDHRHSGLATVLDSRLRSGEVDYTALSRDPAPLDAYLGSLEALEPEDYARFTVEQKKAFWLNAYNAYTMKLVAQHWPVPSIRKIGGLLRSPFKLEFIPLTRLRGRKLSLDSIEHDILRKELFDARIHAAIVCASRGCPELGPEPYRADTVGSRLDAAMRRFLADPGRNRFDPRRQRLELSEIFKWFREDFERDAGSLEAFLERFAPPDMARALAARPRPTIEYLDYDWSINGR